MTNEEYLKKFRRCIYEYVDTSSSVLNEDDPNAVDPTMSAAPAADPAMGAMPADPTMGAAPAADPTMGAMPAADPTMGAAPAADPTMGAMPPADPAMGAAPAAGNQQAPGFTPQQQNNPQDKLDDDMDEMNDDVEDTKKNQEEAEAKIDKLTSKFEEMMSKIDSFEERLNDQFGKLDSLKADIEKRNPTPEERMTLRSKTSYPFGQSIEEYWNDKENDPLSNYSAEDDHNGEDMPEYQIRQSDIDDMRDWRQISKSYDEERNNLRNLLGY